MPLLQFTDKGIYCAAAEVYIDPWRPVKRALITHGHSDHARWGSRRYLCSHAAAPVIRYRLGQEAKVESIAYGEGLRINGVRFSFHPAGHIPGSAQIRVEHRGEIWVASGDYKLHADGLSEAFEPLRCHAFITESTFGLPVFRWPSQESVAEEINTWWRANREAGRSSLLGAYALGKAQRLLRLLDPAIGPIFVHGAIDNTNKVLRQQGIALPPTERITRQTERRRLAGGLVLAPPSAFQSPWAKPLQPASTAFASGWMAMRGTRRRRHADRGFVLSDHADWDELNRAVAATGAERILVTHGYTQSFARWLGEQGYDAQAVQTQYGEELVEEAAADDENGADT